MVNLLSLLPMFVAGVEWYKSVYLKYKQYIYSSAKVLPCSQIHKEIILTNLIFQNE